jgi:hypothetical protein
MKQNTLNGTYITIRTHKHITLHRINNIKTTAKKKFQNAFRQDFEPEAPPSASATCVFPPLPSSPDVPDNVSKEDVL